MVPSPTAGTSPSLNQIKDNEIIFDHGILVVLCLQSNGVARGVAFVIKGGGGLDAVGIEREERIIIFPAYELVSSRIPIRIGGIELTRSSASRLVFQYGQCSGRIKIARRSGSGKRLGLEDPCRYFRPHHWHRHYLYPDYLDWYQQRAPAQY